MRYTPKELPGNVNVSATHPLVELAWLVGGLLALVAVAYLVFWGIAELVVPRVPVDVEVWAGRRLAGESSFRESPELTRRVRSLVETLPSGSSLHSYQFTVSVANNEEVNAVALPGGRIVVFSGLLEKVRSENELAMILGHELGHYAHRDHLRGMGRGFGIALALAMLFGKDSAAAGFASDLFRGMELRYSQKQEMAADAFGLDLLVARYGHAGGATDFFSRLAVESGSTFAYVLASHPHPEDRIARLRAMIRAKGYQLAGTVPLPAAFAGKQTAGCTNR